MKIYKIASNKISEGDIVSFQYKGQTFIGRIHHISGDKAKIMFQDYLQIYNEFYSENITPNGLSEQDTEDLLLYMQGYIDIKDLNIKEKTLNWNREQKNSKYNLIDDEYFQYGGTSYDVRQAKRILHQNPRAIVDFPISEGIQNFLDRIGFTPEPSKKIDLNDPIICIDTGYKVPTPIDGYHRIEKALKNGINSIPAYVLTPKETESIQILY